MSKHRGSRPPSGATPNRDRRREPTTIEGSAVPVEAAATWTGTPGTTADETVSAAPGESLSDTTAEASEPPVARNEPDPEANLVTQPAETPLADAITQSETLADRGATQTEAASDTTRTPAQPDDSQSDWRDAAFADPAPPSADAGAPTPPSRPFIEPPASAEPRRPGIGFPALAAACLVSAGLAAGAVWALAPTPGDTGEIAQLRDRTAALEQRAAAPVAASPQVDIAPLEKRVATLETQVAQTAQAAPRASMDAAQPTAQPDLQPVIQALETRLAALEKEARASKSEERVAQTEAPVTPPPAPPPVDLGPLETRLAALEGRLKPLETATATLGEQVRPLAGRLAPLEESVAPLRSALTDIRGAVDANTARAEAGAASASGAAIAVAAQAVARALDSGAPFKAELDALAKLGAAEQRVAALAPLAERGAPSAAALAKEFASLAPTLAPKPQPAPNASWLDRLSRSATSLVQVRPVGEPTGDAPADLVARVQAATARGAFADALRTWEKLPEAARAASDSWAQKLRARAAAQDAVLAIQTDAVTRLGRS